MGDWRDDRIGELETAVAAKDLRIVELAAEVARVAELDERIAQQDAQLVEQDAKIAALEEKVGGWPKGAERRKEVE